MRKLTMLKLMLEIAKRFYYVELYCTASHTDKEVSKLFFTNWSHSQLFPRYNFHESVNNNASDEQNLRSQKITPRAFSFQIPSQTLQLTSVITSDHHNTNKCIDEKRIKRTINPMLKSQIRSDSDERGTSAVELDGALQFGDGGGVSGGNGVGELLESLVVVGDVSLVVLLVVDSHDIAADCGLESAVVVREVRQREGLEAAGVDRHRSRAVEELPCREESESHGKC